MKIQCTLVHFTGWETVSAGGIWWCCWKTHRVFEKNPIIFFGLLHVHFSSTHSSDILKYFPLKLGKRFIIYLDIWHLIFWEVPQMPGLAGSRKVDFFLKMCLHLKDSINKVTDNSFIAQFKNHIYVPKDCYKQNTVALLFQCLY